MPEMNTFWLKIAFIGVVGLLYVEPARTAQSSSPCDGATVPTPISELLNDKFPQWRPKRISDMDADNQRFWLEGRNGETCPGIAIGHFESVSRLSYAFLLVPRSNPSGGYKVVIFSKDASKDVYSSTLLDHADEQTYSGIVIFRAEPGKYKDLTGKNSIQIRTDVLYLEWIEKGAQLYYWSAGRYHKLQVSD